MYRGSHLGESNHTIWNHNVVSETFQTISRKHPTVLGVMMFYRRNIYLFKRQEMWVSAKYRLDHLISVFYTLTASYSFSINLRQGLNPIFHYSLNYERLYLFQIFGSKWSFCISFEWKLIYRFHTGPNS